MKSRLRSAWYSASAALSAAGGAGGLVIICVCAGIRMVLGLRGARRPAGTFAAGGVVATSTKAS